MFARGGAPRTVRGREFLALKLPHQEFPAFTRTNPPFPSPRVVGTAFGLEASLGAPYEFDADASIGAEGDPQHEQAPMDWLAQRRKPRR